MSGPDTVRRTVDTVWRMESAKIIAVLARTVNDVGLAEELASDAAVAALEQWPVDGVPDRPAAWLMVTGKRRAVDRIRRDQNLKTKYQHLAGRLEASGMAVDPIAEAEAELDDDIGDELLRVIFCACHPVLSPEARAALTLKAAAGLSTAEIARAYLTSESTVAQRIVRAKRKLESAGVTFEAPGQGEFAVRLDAVLEVVYLIFNEGYTATGGHDLMRPELCQDAQRLAQRLTALVPDQPEVLGLAALLDFQASRTRTRVDSDGELVPLPEQDRSKWDRLLIRRGLAALHQASAWGDDAGPYRLQAAIAACHARAARPGETDWVRIAGLYSRLLNVQPSPVVALNRAVAFGEAFGPQSGLDRVDEIADLPALAGYHLVPAVRGEMLERLGHKESALAEFERAASLAYNERERARLTQRAADLRNTI
ncbi:RNA polymerase sigma factor [Glycomyces buryatensis]|uniref:RNA polymerase sigma factor n=1 Tax=Glycomyces buryatensis TaxID=2570927 RepID=A0A4S8Q5C6_9ACTN|nr:RNA polymerase sigma factor [Glycomyces buryatensis]THV39473.1 RNA polymerase sigma factor [Glycomyces buryatensis]